MSKFFLSGLFVRDGLVQIDTSSAFIAFMQHKKYKKIILVILDGFGVASPGPGNPIALARTPNLDQILANYPALSLQASGPLVGLPWGEVGNSEVGHLNIGAGRIVGQNLPRITTSIQSGDFFKNSVFLEAIDHAKKNKSSLHIMGLMSPGGVHSLDEHAFALLSMAADAGITNIYIHMFTDGRDTEEQAALETVKKIRFHIRNNNAGEIATVAGRFYALDRGGHWGQTLLVYNALVNGRGEIALSAEECIQRSYSSQIFDEMIMPTVIVKDANNREPVSTIADNDAVIFTNFRPDRALQLAQMFVKPDAVPLEFRSSPLNNLYFATMTEYDPQLPAHVAFPPMDLKGNLAEVLSQQGFSQFHIAESEKYAHVTIFFNCGAGDKFPGEDRVIITSPSDNSRNYADSPQMSAKELTDVLTKRIVGTETNFFIANFANCDMVGHTGNLKASIAAVEYIDQCLGKIVQSALQADAALLITSDHGNIEQMMDRKTGNIDKDHTTNPVPLLLIAGEFKFPSPLEKNFLHLSVRTPAGVISDIAPTVLELFGLPRPPQMTGVSLMDTFQELGRS